MTTSTQPPRSAAPKRKRATTTSSITTSTEPITPSNKRRCLTLTRILCLSGHDDEKTLSAVDARYEVQIQSVISSSKIKQRVSAMLRHLALPARPPSIEPLPNPAPAKTAVSILRAKASEAGKLVTIAEVVKREIEKEQPASGPGAGEAGQVTKTGCWFQYIALGEEMRQRHRDQDSTVLQDTVLGGGLGADKEESEEDDEFELMKTPFERAVEGQPLVRGVPVMSLFLSRSSIEELKRRYGEQTSAPRIRELTMR
jgi:hypothetical protein